MYNPAYNQILQTKETSKKMWLDIKVIEYLWPFNLKLHNQMGTFEVFNMKYVLGTRNYLWSCSFTFVFWLLAKGFIKPIWQDKTGWVKKPERKYICTYLLVILKASYSKGQLISEWIFGVFKSSKKPTTFLTDFCPMKLVKKQ